ncbi:hypothetical protein MLC59_18045 [Marinobacter bryozoorum]|uniref:hypothetical protein n=1 Tax=Marinobacter bryozoorum TaxID=256324 RepID=UPI002002C328|nr:hypothetical protein [Marinobacter bryozoorum]MCK7546063.1 hypothetical protein [Marinobacter bryozoorum]
MPRNNGTPVSHDQNFKNLILDYPRQAIDLFCEQEARELDYSVRIVPLRQEQLKERLGERFRELDVPLQAEWPDGRREALVFVLEEETNPNRFSIHRLAHYCLDLADLCETQRVVPVVIFLNTNGSEPARLVLGSERYDYLQFQCIRCALPELEAEDYWDSNNLIARLCLSLMHWNQSQKLEVYARATRGLTTLERDPEKQLKYLDFIDIYTALDDNEMEQYQQHYPQESNTMASLSDRLRAEGMEKGLEQGIEKGMEKGLHDGVEGTLRKQIQLKFGAIPAWADEQLKVATDEQLDRWVTGILEAGSLESLLGVN